MQAFFIMLNKNFDLHNILIKNKAYILFILTHRRVKVNGTLIQDL